MPLVPRAPWAAALGDSCLSRGSYLAQVQVGEACQQFDRIYRAPLGMYISAFQHRGRFK